MPTTTVSPINSRAKSSNRVRTRSGLSAEAEVGLAEELTSSKRGTLPASNAIGPQTNSAHSVTAGLGISCAAARLAGPFPFRFLY
jgi:hypothetical protein